MSEDDPFDPSEELEAERLRAETITLRAALLAAEWYEDGHLWYCPVCGEVREDYRGVPVGHGAHCLIAAALALPDAPG